MTHNRLPRILKYYRPAGRRNLGNPLNAELNPICHLLELLGAHHILHVSRIRVKETYRRVRQKRVNLWPICMLAR